MPSLFPMAPMKWKAGSRKEDDDGWGSGAMAHPTRGRLSLILAKNESSISLRVREVGEGISGGGGT